MDDQFAPEDRYYGVRYHESAGQDLYRVAGMILGDLKIDQVEEHMPADAVLVVAVAANTNTITVQVHLQSDEVRAQWGSETIRSRVNVVMARYNWVGRRNGADVRYRTACKVAVVRGRLDAQMLGSIIG
ncbi:hypothetical protein ALI144C_44910 [Actinosynnema sp. ALI-1.44]|uniref:hypothetical protein n=1 Tax=Actinosynnema sp. ALI-1.44 TaxID=1933779 RepID=UPI00097C4FD2|nr:hypothetical protein [Actinosynnema sp. ALI-1.44]ONI73094.1 hypothetical protein ALI144C_44910 [Actinosynnema sp. ALI-1.44]